MPVRELNAAAILLQLVYRSYRTRCSSADFANMVEKLWWKISDFAALRQSSVTFFRLEEPETAVSRWSRVKTRVKKVVKGLSRDERAQKLAFKYWLEAIDPRHRYGTNLHLYYVEWLKSNSPQPFFYWLDFGDGKEVSLVECPRIALQDQCIQYLGPKERETYEVIIDHGKLVYRCSGCPVDTPEDTKWIFVLSTSRKLYVGQKKKGLFQHSSFVAGGATIAAGRLISSNGILQAIWLYSGHYRPPEENFVEMINFLEEHHVDLSHVKTFPLDDDVPPPPRPCKIATGEQPKSDTTITKAPSDNNSSITDDQSNTSNIANNQTFQHDVNCDNSENKISTPVAEMQRRLYSKCTNLQFQEVEDTNYHLECSQEQAGHCIPNSYTTKLRTGVNGTTGLTNSSGPHIK